MKLVEDLIMLSGDLTYPHSLWVRQAADIIEHQSGVIKQCGAMFREYEIGHRDKASKAPDKSVRSNYEKKMRRNKELADMCEAALEKTDAR